MGVLQSIYDQTRTHGNVVKKSVVKIENDNITIKRVDSTSKEKIDKKQKVN